MPLKLQVGTSQKIGQPDYGSLGASCHVELELDASLIQHDLETFHRHVKNAYVACRQAVQDELARDADVSPPGGNGHQGGNGHANGHRNGGSRNGNGNGRDGSGSRKATSSQVRAIHAIANRQGVRLTEELEARFGVSSPEDLSIRQASECIDELKAEPATTGGRR
tara:strand:- start:131763 stop:132260 length:498 start_codon:yes stop_codon:yes gene_type:complete